MRTMLHDDEGQMIPLIIGYVCVALMMILVAVAASSVHLQRKELLGLADGAALAAADEATQESYLDSGVAPEQNVPLTDAGVQQAAGDYLRLAAPTLSDLRLATPTGAPGGRTAEVTLQARARLPFVGWVLRGWDAGIELQVTSRAEVQLS